MLFRFLLFFLNLLGRHHFNIICFHKKYNMILFTFMMKIYFNHRLSLVASLRDKQTYHKRSFCYIKHWTANNLLLSFLHDFIVLVPVLLPPSFLPSCSSFFSLSKIGLFLFLCHLGQIDIVVCRGIAEVVWDLGGYSF